MASHPLISTVVTINTLIFLYFPTIIAFSPVLISTSIVLLSLLRLGAAQGTSQVKAEQEKPQSEPDPDSDSDCYVVSNSERDPDCLVGPICENPSVFEPEPNSGYAVFEPESKLYNGECFLEWNVRAPLEVIYEAYEGEGEDGGDFGAIQRYASLSMYYPEMDTDSDCSSDGNLRDDLCFRWDEDEDREESIEIKLDCKRNIEVEEDNLIEIDLTLNYFPAR